MLSRQSQPEKELLPDFEETESRQSCSDPEKWRSIPDFDAPADKILAFLEHVEHCESHRKIIDETENVVKGTLDKVTREGKNLATKVYWIRVVALSAFGILMVALAIGAGFLYSDALLKKVDQYDAEISLGNAVTIKGSAKIEKLREGSDCKVTIIAANEKDDFPFTSSTCKLMGNNLEFSFQTSSGAKGDAIGLTDNDNQEIELHFMYISGSGTTIEHGSISLTKK